MELRGGLNERNTENLQRKFGELLDLSEKAEAAVKML
jgi:hypothetical protein